MRQHCTATATKPNWILDCIHMGITLDTPSLPLSEAQIWYKAQAKLTHNTDHQTPKQFQELISQHLTFGNLLNILVNQNFVVVAELCFFYLKSAKRKSSNPQIHCSKLNFWVQWQQRPGPEDINNRANMKLDMLVDRCPSIIKRVATHLAYFRMIIGVYVLPRHCNRKMVPQRSQEPQVTAGWPGRVLTDMGAVPPHLSREDPVMETRVKQQDSDHQAPVTVQDQGQERIYKVRVRTDPPLAKAKPISGGGGTGITYLRKGKRSLHNSNCSWKRGVRICEKNHSANTEASEEGGGGGAPGAGAEIPLQPVVNTVMSEAVLLQPMEVYSGAHILLQPTEDPMLEQVDD
ncbi:protein pxr1-like [Limosa lapponica baueri]|uniref:Protein pxr1-like n=1 Tax=Limosa lapponica baueri TaxID=1758121 RepID=A0A2I0UGI7_LIMLA|nr:protein pxr1-like [Limosa lapponica baueri]